MASIVKTIKRKWRRKWKPQLIEWLEPLEAKFNGFMLERKRTAQRRSLHRKLKAIR